MNYISELKKDSAEIAPIVNSSLEEIFSSDILPIHGELLNDREILKKYLAKSGRGIGGSMVLRMAGIINPDINRETVLSVCAATEILNAGILIVDDWMDESDYRKNQPTVHERYIKEISNWSNSPDLIKHKAESLAVQLGMVATYISNIIITKQAHIQRDRIIRNMQTGSLRVTSGCMLEQKLAFDEKLQTEQNIMSVYANKTGWYSFEAPMRTGLIIAGIDDGFGDQLAVTARLLGLAFQFQDDVAGTFGDTAITGKPNTDDMREGLYTMLFHEARNQLSKKDFNVLRSLHGKRNISISESELYKQLIAYSGADKILQRRSMEFLEDAERHLTDAWHDEWNNEVFEYLYSIIEYFRSKDYTS